MRPAAERMAEALEKADIRGPLTPLVANVTAEEAFAPDVIRDLLVKQVTGRVRWTESVVYMVEKGCATFVEIGAGKVLGGLVKRINREASTLNVGEPGDVEAFAKL